MSIGAREAQDRPAFQALLRISAPASPVALGIVAVAATVLGVWRLGADPGWTNTFPIRTGWLSHYQLWFAIAAGAGMAAVAVNRRIETQPAVLPPVIS